MLEIPTQRRPLLLLAVVVAAQVLLLAVQIKRERNLRLIRVWTVELFTPMQRTGTFVIDKVHNGWSSYIGLRHADQENERLRTQVAQLELRAQQLEGRAAEAERLAALLSFRQAHADVPMLPARVIGASPAATSNTIYIDRGEKSGLRKNMGVITPDGVVGKILEAYPDTSQILLMTDRESGIGALLADTRTQGVVKGTGAPAPMLDYVLNEEKVPVGESILTSGMDRIFPKDLTIGTVASAQPGNPLQVIQVRPAAHLGRLEEVLVLLTLQPLEGSREAAQPAAKPAKVAAQPAKPTTPPEKVAAQPTKPPAQPEKPSTPPAKAKEQPTKPTMPPVKPAPQPEKPTPPPTKPPAQAEKPAPQPEKPTPPPTKPPEKPAPQPEKPTPPPTKPPAQAEKPAPEPPTKPSGNPTPPPD